MMKGALGPGAALIPLLCSGCVISSPIVPSGTNTFVVSSRSSACLTCASASKAVQAANQFCAAKGKSLVIRNTSGYMNPFGYNTENQLVFTCLDENDPALRRSASTSGTIFVDPTQD